MPLELLTPTLEKQTDFPDLCELGDATYEDLLFEQLHSLDAGDCKSLDYSDIDLFVQPAPHRIDSIHKLSDGNVIKSDEAILNAKEASPVRAEREAQFVEKNDIASSQFVKTFEKTTGLPKLRDLEQPTYEDLLALDLHSVEDDDGSCSSLDYSDIDLSVEGSPCLLGKECGPESKKRKLGKVYHQSNSGTPKRKAKIVETNENFLGASGQEAIVLSCYTEEEAVEWERVRRERNKLAARRCRQKQKDRIDELEITVAAFLHDNSQLDNEIQDLRRQLKDLTDALSSHKCIMKR